MGEKVDWYEGGSAARMGRASSSSRVRRDRKNSSKRGVFPASSGTSVGEGFSALSLRDAHLPYNHIATRSSGEYGGGRPTLLVGSYNKKQYSVRRNRTGTTK